MAFVVVGVLARQRGDPGQGGGTQRDRRGVALLVVARHGVLAASPRPCVYHGGHVAVYRTDRHTWRALFK
ncbi:hypothetical protein [Marilutibacter aestuarii]|uniref:Uncharacterized protein n=1 Tax=Marilutibacter aestuarii TaxID=1706195 RepID=A0A508AMF4_9GAMM|nr:hypothetical protein [Lysobacter aestuarii]TQD50979.1 hypothetical protein FKV25_02985 [Lysobacter aestuarii]